MNENFKYSILESPTPLHVLRSPSFMPDFPQLEFLPVESLLVHERHDEQRARRWRRMRASEVCNPPIVSPLRDGSQRYMVLDGANRVTALGQLGLAHALVQVVQPDDPGLTLQNWNHVIWEINPARFMDGLAGIPAMELLPVEIPPRNPTCVAIAGCGAAWRRAGLCSVHTGDQPGGTGWALNAIDKLQGSPGSAAPSYAHWLRFAIIRRAGQLSRIHH
jgi:hypothetical protein